MTEFLVYASKHEKIDRYATFKIQAENKQDAENKVREELEGTCLAERLTIDNYETVRDEGKIIVDAESITDSNKNDLEKAELVEYEDFSKILAK